MSSLFVCTVCASHIRRLFGVRAIVAVVERIDEGQIHKFCFVDSRKYYTRYVLRSVSLCIQSQSV